MDQETDVHLLWHHHQTTVLSVFSSLLDNGNLVDCTISAEGQHFKAHRVILSACSPYFDSLFSEHCETHPIVILPDVKFKILKSLMVYMYSGEINVPQNELCTVLELAENLQIKGLSLTGDNEMKNELRAMRRNESVILCDQQVFRKRQCESSFGSQVDQREDVSSLHTLEKECPEDIYSHLLTTNKYEKDSSGSGSPEETHEEPAMSQDISDTVEAFNVVQCPPFTKTFSKSNTCVSFSNIIGINQFPASSKENIGKRVKLSENVLSTCLAGEEPQSTNAERPVMDHVPEIKQEDPDDFNSDSVEEIILDDNIDESDDNDRGFGDDNSGTVAELMRVIPEESFSGQGFSNLDDFRDPYFEEPASILPNRFNCNYCGKSYRYRRSLWRHLKHECGKGPQFRCSHCPARYTQRHHLRAHMERFHLS